MKHLIELVRSKPCLYDTNHPDYSKKTLKDLLWTRIAKEAKYEDGPSAKDAWLKLRNCHRDAIRRRNKLNKSGSAPAVTKVWKFEKQMEFLIPHMTNRPPSGDVSAENASQYELTQPEDLINYPEVKFETTSQHNDPLLMEISSQMLSPNISGSQSEVPPAPMSFPPRPQMSPKFTDVRARDATSKEFDLNTLITRTLDSHEKRSKEQAEQRAFNRDNEDDLQQFFNTMYTITKKMPALSQHKLKRKIFNLVSDEEEFLLNLKPSPIAIAAPVPSNPHISMNESSEQYN